ncbi:MAG: sulfur carrier protein ThiS [Xanthomonadales bacterium]|nr:sulfur carrier protein ThiS [Xanthomonadales bacterium]
MIEITVNGEALSVKPDLDIPGLLQQLGLAEKRVAVELNREIIPRSQHSETALSQGDAVEIVHAIGGG